MHLSKVPSQANKIRSALHFCLRGENKAEIEDIVLIDVSIKRMKTFFSVASLGQHPIDCVSFLLASYRQGIVSISPITSPICSQLSFVLLQSAVNGNKNRYISIIIIWERRLLEWRPGQKPDIKIVVRGADRETNKQKFNFFLSSRPFVFQFPSLFCTPTTKPDCYFPQKAAIRRDLNGLGGKTKVGRSSHHTMETSLIKI